MTEFPVCVRCMTYNQSSFIVDTLNGFVSQRTDFPFVCVIMDDASTDGEDEVILQYLTDRFVTESTSETDDYRSYFAQCRENGNCYFAVFLLKYNHRSIRKSKDAYHPFNRQAKYIAYCEGDDWWISPHKLQKQYDYLEAHPKCGMVHTKVKTYDQATGRFGRDRGFKAYCKLRLLVTNPVVTLSVMIRSELFNAFWTELRADAVGWYMGDYPLWLYVHEHHTSHLLEEVMGCYRILPESASHTGKADKIAAMNETGREVRKYFAKRYGYDCFVVMRMIDRVIDKKTAKELKACQQSKPSK